MSAKKPSAANIRLHRRQGVTGRAVNNKNQLSFLKTSLAKHAALAVTLSLFLIMCGVYWWFFSGGMTLTEAKGMETYLQNRYGKPFTIKNVHIENKYFGDAMRIVGEATPHDDSEITVRVVQSENKAYDDEYLKAYWTKSEKSKIDTLIRQVYSQKDTPEYSYNIEPSPDFYKRATIQNHTPTLDEALTDYGDDIFYALNIKERGTVTPHSAASYIKKLVNFLREKTPQAYLSYTLIQSPEQSLKCEIRMINIDEKTDIEKCFKESKRRS